MAGDIRGFLDLEISGNFNIEEPLQIMSKRNGSSNTPSHAELQSAEDFCQSGMFVDVATAIRILRCSRITFYRRVKDGIYREARFRVGDPAPTERLFRAPELIVDEERRIHACQRAGHRTGWEERVT